MLANREVPPCVNLIHKRYYSVSEFFGDARPALTRSYIQRLDVWDELQASEADYRRVALRNEYA
jgi:hypothetical protein